ncbi:MAG: MFS transporter [Xanthobacteraceae bacterium]
MTSASAQASTAPSTQFDARGTWTVFAMTAICMTVVAYNTTAAITILPNLKSDFDLRPVTLQWVMTIYTLAAASLVPIFGRLGDILRKIYVFIFGMAIFAVGALFVAVSPDSIFLLIGRLLQGIGAGTMVGNSLGVLTAATPEDKRTFIFGLWSGMISLGMSLGPVIGGLFAEYANWRGIFVMDMVLLAIAASIAVPVVRRNYVPDSRPPNARFDYVGGVFMILLLAPLTYGLSMSGSAGWTSARVLLAFAIALVAGIIFFITEMRVKQPLMHLHYFLHPRFVMSALGMAISGYMLLAFFFYFNLFVQSPNTLHMSPVTAGLAVLPYSLVMFALSVTVPKILAPYSFRWPVTIGMALMAIACFLLAKTTNSTSYDALWWKLVILGIGFGLTFPLLPRVGLRLVREEDSGQASGVINTSLFIGATIGVVVAGMASAIAVRSQVWGVIAALPTDSYDRDELATAVTYGSSGEIQKILGGLESAHTSQAIAAALRTVQDDAFNAAILTGAVVSALGAVLAIWLMRGPIPEPRAAAKLLPQDKATAT